MYNRMVMITTAEIREGFARVQIQECDCGGKCGSAHVNCWIDHGKHRKAEGVARQYIQDCGWSVEAKEEDRATSK
jgi:hypothetical protein